MKTQKQSFLKLTARLVFFASYPAIILIFLFFAFNVNAQKKSDNSTGSLKGLSGDGTSPGNPVQIGTLDQLRIVSEDPDFRDKHLALVADIDATDTKNWNVADHDNDEETPEVAMGFLPIGHFHSTPTRFSGSFEGNGHTISNLYIYHQTSSGDHAGLFGSVETDFYIRNVNLTNINFTCKYGGGLISKIHKGYVKNCHTSGTVKGIWGSLGGVVGSTTIVNNKSVDIDNCTSSCEVIGGSPLKNVTNVGGLIGNAFAYGNDGEYLSITNCSASGDVSCNGEYVGGLIGNASDSILISNCSATGDVSGLGRCGGLIGLCSGKGSNVKTAKVINCNSSGKVSVISGIENSSAIQGMGGFIGKLNDNVLIDRCNTTADTIAIDDAIGVGGFIGSYGANGGHSLVKNSFTDVKYVSGKQYIGGFLGDGAGAGSSKITFENCYTKSDVYASYDGFASAGGFAGRGPDYLFNCISYGNVESPGHHIGGFIGIGRGIKMETCYSYGESVSGNNKTGGFIGYDYTDTLINCHSMVKTVAGNEDIGGFYGYSSTNLNSGCTTRADVEATGDNVGGYAGRMASSGSSQLMRCYAKGNVISSGEKHTGGFIGSAGGIKILECYATGNVKGNQYVGGLCGLSENVVQCFATGNVSGTKYVGGLVGRSYDVENSFATGNVSCSSYGGGIASYWSTVQTSYATGSVNGSGDYIGGAFGSMTTSSTKKCYFDQTANPNLLGNGDDRYLDESTGLATPQFAYASNFDTWDFTDIWQIGVIKWIDVFERPYLKWQLEEGPSSPITSIAIENQLSETVINENETLVTIAMPFGTDITNLALIFQLADGAEMIINDSTQISGVTKNNFTTPLIGYIVQSLNKSALFDSKETANDTMLWIIEVENQSHLLTFSSSEKEGLLNGGSQQLVKDKEASNAVEAIPNQGYRFVHWEDNEGEIQTTDSILVIQSVTQSESFTAIFELKTGISDIETIDFGCFPNPTQGLVEIQFHKPYTGYLEVFSITGVTSKKIMMIDQISASLDLSELKSGFYFIKAGNYNTKILKQ
jgi:hypothetical protein